MITVEERQWKNVCHNCSPGLEMWSLVTTGLHCLCLFQACTNLQGQYNEEKIYVINPYYPLFFVTPNHYGASENLYDKILYCITTCLAVPDQSNNLLTAQPLQSVVVINRTNTSNRDHYSVPLFSTWPPGLVLVGFFLQGLSCIKNVIFTTFARIKNIFTVYKTCSPWQRHATTGHHPSCLLFY